MNCNKCGAPVPGNLTICPYCGNAITAAPPRDSVDEATDFAEKDENDFSATPEEQTEYAGDISLPEDVPAPPAHRYAPPHETIPQRNIAPYPSQPKRKQSKAKPKRTAGSQPKAPFSKQTTLRIVLVVVLVVLIVLLICSQLLA